MLLEPMGGLLFGNNENNLGLTNLLAGLSNTSVVLNHNQLRHKTVFLKELHNRCNSRICFCSKIF